MSFAALEGEPEFSREEDPAALPLSGTVTMPDLDPEMMAMLGPPRRPGSTGNLHRVPSPQGWMIGFSGWPTLVLSDPTLAP